jgi:hypothetical protein
MSTVDRINRAVEAYADKDIVFRYFSREVVMSDTARRNWIEPDVNPWRSATGK